MGQSQPSHHLNKLWWAQDSNATYQVSRQSAHRFKRFLNFFTIYGHLGHVTWIIWINFRSPIPWRLQMKFDFNQPSDCLKMLTGWQTTDDNNRAYSYDYKQGTSNEYPQHIFLWSIKKNTNILDWKRILSRAMDKLTENLNTMWKLQIQISLLKTLQHIYAPKSWTSTNWNKSSEEEPVMSRTTNGTERQAVSLEWSGNLDCSHLKREGATFDFWCSSRSSMGL